MPNVMIEQIDIVSNHQLSQCSFEDDDDTFDVNSFSEESFSGESFDEAQLEATSRRLEVTRSCIDDALAVLTSPVQALKSQNKLDIPDFLSPMSFRSDGPPSRPRRSFDNLKHESLLRTMSDCAHDRFSLSTSEHISRSFRAPRRPSRKSEGKQDKYGGSKISSQTNEEWEAKDIKSESRSSSRHSPLSDSQSSRASTMRPPSRCPSSKSRASRDSRLSAASSGLGPSEHGQVTLRGSQNRVLLGTREMSTSQHLRRRCPSRTSQ